LKWASKIKAVDHGQFLESGLKPPKIVGKKMHKLLDKKHKHLIWQKAKTKVQRNLTGA